MNDRLYTAAEAADMLGISTRRVRGAAATLGVGQRIGRRVLAFTEADIERLRNRRPPGRPRKGKTDAK